MTYDKVQFALNKHHYVQHRNTDNNPVDPAVEVEKVSISPTRQKRISSTYESNLPNISEEIEQRKYLKNDLPCHDITVGSSRLVKEKSGFENGHFQFEIKQRDNLDNKLIHCHTKGEEKTKLTYSGHFTGEEQSFHADMSVCNKSRTEGKVSEANNSDKCSKSGSSRRNYESERTEVPDRGLVKDVIVPELDIGENAVNKRKTHADSLSNIVSNKGTGLGSPFSERDDQSTFPKAVKCEHMIALQAYSEDDSLVKKYIRKNMKNNPNKCMICEVTEATAKYASVEANRLLLEIVYPHEFYDKFQRSGKRTKVGSNQKNMHTTKSQISMCKPAPVSEKPWRREKTTLLSSRTNARENQAPPNTARESYGNKLREKSDHDLSPQKRIKRDGDNESRKEIHLQCKAKNNALVVTDDSEGQKLVLKGLKGWILKKDDNCKNKIHREIKESLYQVNSLGMKFSIPVYNTSLPDRKPQTERLFTNITSPCPVDVHTSVRKTVSQSTSPRNHVTYESPPRDVHTVPTRPVYGLQRGYTHVPKLFSDSRTEDTFKGFQMTKVNTSSESNPTENDIPFQNGRTKLSLPPINNDMKSRSLTLSQF